MNRQPEGSNSEDAAFVREAGRLLRAGADELDGASRSRLSRARQAALARLDGRRPTSSWRPAWAAAAVAVLAIALGQWLQRTDVPAATAPVATGPVAGHDMDLLLAGEELEMLQDLEFFAWLEEDDLAVAPGTSG
jgi:hypothetical protein